MPYNATVVFFFIVCNDHEADRLTHFSVRILKQEEKKKRLVRTFYRLCTPGEEKQTDVSTRLVGGGGGGISNHFPVF